jgi:mono/diheme cytochrome c family protein
MKTPYLGYRGRVLGTVAGLLALTAFVAPDFPVSVWSGVYSPTQAERGRAAFESSCAMCHSPDLSGRGPIPALRGTSFTDERHGTSLSDLYGLIRTTMPPSRPGDLTPQTYADVVAYLLSANAYPAGEGDLPHHEESLRGIVFDTGAPENAGS